MLGLSEKHGSEERIVSVLDIGTSKVCCLIAELAGDNMDTEKPGAPLQARLLGFGAHRSKGVKAGVVVDLGKAEDAVRKAISRAEEMAGRQIDDVVISVSGGRISSMNFTATTEVAGSHVSDGDVARVFNAGRNFAVRDRRMLLHLNGLGFGLDNEEGISEPRGMGGSKLRADLHAVTADELPLRNLTALIDRCYLKASSLVAAPFASALSSVNDEEARLGVLCVDIGGGTTSLAVFAEGHFIHADAFAIGGTHITYDIARRLSTPLDEAERIKTLYGNLVAASSDAHEVVSYPVIDQDEVGLYQISRAELCEIIRPRVEEILLLVRDRLERNKMTAYASDRLVLTGGGAGLAGMQEFAELKLGMHARIGRPETFAGVPETLEGLPYAVAMGLVRAAAGAQGQGRIRTPAGPHDKSYLGQMSQWFKESFWDDERDQRVTGS